MSSTTIKIGESTYEMPANPAAAIPSTSTASMSQQEFLAALDKSIGRHVNRLIFWVVGFPILLGIIVWLIR